MVEAAADPGLSDLRPRGLRAPAVLLGLAAAAALALAVGAVALGAGGLRRYERPAPPPPAGAFRDGGAPARDPAIERALAVELPAAVRARDASRLRDLPGFGAAGDALLASWRGFADCLARFFALDAEAAPDRARRAALADELHARALAVSDQLAGRGLGYYLNASQRDEHSEHLHGVTGFRVDAVVFVRANTERVRVLHLRGLDDLAPAGAAGVALGVASSTLDDPIVLLDAVDRKVAAQVLPVLGGAGFPLGAGARQLDRIAGDAIRRELIAALGADAADPERATARARRLVAASAGRHEAHHALDLRGSLPHPQPLIAALGRTSPHVARQARLELSAYLGQIASDTWLPQLMLWSLARHGFRGPGGSSGASVEPHVAVVVLEGLAARLGVELRGSALRDGGTVDRARLAALVAPLAAVPTLELRAAAAALWADLFHAPLVRIYDDL